VLYLKKEVKWNIDIQIHDIILKNIERYWNINFLLNMLML